jgi:hypothetical protein
MIDVRDGMFPNPMFINLLVGRPVLYNSSMEKRPEAAEFNTSTSPISRFPRPKKRRERRLEHSWAKPTCILVYSTGKTPETFSDIVNCIGFEVGAPRQLPRRLISGRRRRCLLRQKIEYFLYRRQYPKFHVLARIFGIYWQVKIRDHGLHIAFGGRQSRDTMRHYVTFYCFPWNIGGNPNYLINVL